MTSTPNEPGAVVSLHSLGEDLLAEARAGRTGRAARTVVTVPGLRTTLLALTAGRELAEHQAPGAATLICLTGQARLATAEQEWNLQEDVLMAIPDQRHRLVADSDTLVLLTVRLD